MTFFMHELFLIYKGLRDAFFSSLFLLWKMMTVFIARHITVRTHEADGQACFPTESLSSRQLSLSRPGNSGSCQGMYRNVTVTVANSRWLLWLHHWYRIKADGRMLKAYSLSFDLHKNLLGVGIIIIIFIDEETGAQRREATFPRLPS